MRNVPTIAFVGPLLLSLAIIAAAQNPQLAFEVATIKPSGSPTGGAVSSLAICHGVDSFVPSFQDTQFNAPAQGRCLLIRRSLKAAIAFAYHPGEPTRLTVEDRVAGGPEWASSALFDIAGKAQDVASATDSQLRSMLLQLVTDRFKLQTHIAQREVKGYALVLAKNGHKMQPGRGSSNFRYSPLRGMSASNAPMDLLARELGRLVVKIPVIDETGLNGGYAFSLPATSELDPLNTSGPSIFTALQEELGLRLEAAKVPVDVIVIDHAEKPSEN
jgi:uncharacterized protein (TIGR03435 family)